MSFNYRKIGRPKGTTARRDGKVTTIHVNNETREYALSRGMSLSSMMNHTPLWHRRMEELAEEIIELRQGVQKKDAIIQQQYKEIGELQNFKNKVLKKWNEERENGKRIH